MLQPVIPTDCPDPRSTMDHPMNSPDPDIIRIQERIAYLEQTVTELSSVLYEQHKEINRITRLVDRLTATLKSAEITSSDLTPSEKPPHH